MATGRWHRASRRMGHGVAPLNVRAWRHSKGAGARRRHRVTRAACAPCDSTCCCGGRWLRHGAFHELVLLRGSGQRRTPAAQTLRGGRCSERGGGVPGEGTQEGHAGTRGLPLGPASVGGAPGSDGIQNRTRWSARVLPGAGERIRTADLPFTRRLLCQLSYTGGETRCMVAHLGDDVRIPVLTCTFASGAGTGC